MLFWVLSLKQNKPAIGLRRCPNAGVERDEADETEEDYHILVGMFLYPTRHRLFDFLLQPSYNWHSLNTGRLGQVVVFQP